MAGIVRKLSGHLLEAGLVVEFMDESLTSRESEQQLREQALTAAQRRKVIDGLAAIKILERYVAAKD